MVADYNLSDGTIFYLMALLKKISTVLTTGAGGEDIAVKTMREGVFDYLIKDIDRNYLKILPLLSTMLSNQKKTENQITMLSFAMMNIFDSVYITDAADKIIIVNKSLCKKIRDDSGYGNQIEHYTKDHSEAEFSPSLCPEYAKSLYPELLEIKE